MVFLVMVEYVSEYTYAKRTEVLQTCSGRNSSQNSCFVSLRGLGHFRPYRKGVAERLCNARSTFGNLVCLASSVTVYFTMITKYLLTLQNFWGLLIRSTYWF